MFVLIDLEWTIGQSQEKELTQIAAVRVDENWEISSEFHKTVRPGKPENVDWQHVAYNGYSKEQFLSSPQEQHCVTEFARWLRKEDVVCSWAYSVRATLKEIWLREFGKKPAQAVLTTNDRVYDQLSATNQQANGLYAIAQRYGIVPLCPEHCAKNDAYMMLALFRVLFDRPDRLGEKRIPSKEARNAAILQKTAYNYVYTPTSGVFHLPGCKRILRANEVIGCERYKTACRKRRPCKICNPLPPIPAEKSASKPAAQKPPRPVEMLQSIRLLDQTVVLTYPSKIVGCCHNQIHPGKMTRKQMEGHDCLGKQCKYFEKYETSAYWQAQQQKQKEKQKRKQKKRQEKENQRVTKTEEQTLLDELQYYADFCEYKMEIIDVKQERKNLYKVFYVSDYNYADGQRYMGLSELARHAHPGWRLLLRHIRDEQGRFVTIEEFYARRRT